MRFKFLLLFLLLCFSQVAVALVPSFVVADTQSGYILSSKNADRIQYPASLTKVMTLYLTFQALDSKILKMDDLLPVSKTAASQPKSKIYLKAGDTISVKEAIYALILKSANDVAVVLAESLAPSEEDFALIMNSVAQDLGLSNTVFKNASGLHDEEQVTTAKDMAVLTLALINHYPKYYKLFSEKKYTIKGKKYTNHNPLLHYYKGAEGLKTGFISAGGYNIITTAKRNGRRLVGVVLGQTTEGRRNRKAASILDKGFSKLKNDKMFLAMKEKNPLNRLALIQEPQSDIYLPIMSFSIKQSRELAFAYQHIDANSTPVGVKNLEVDDFIAFQGEPVTSWGIQVGAFALSSTAQKQAKRALGILKTPDKIIQTPPVGNLFRSRIVGFSSKENATRACQQMTKSKIQCIPIPPQI